MKNIKLNSGRIVSISGFSILKTYGGLLTADTSEELNRIIYSRITCPNDWRTTDVIKIEPTELDFKNRLKPCHFSVRLESNKPIDPVFDASQLVSVWLDEFPESKTIEQIITEKIATVDWDLKAHDFLY